MLCAGTIFVTAQEVAETLPVTATSDVFGGGNDKTDKDKKAAEDIKDPLIKILLSKGLITLAEAQALAAGGASTGQRDALAALLVSKGIISAAELDAVRPANSPVPITVNASLKTETTIAPTVATAAQTAPAVIPAVAPLRVLQLEGVKRDVLIPDIKLGSGAKLKLYGFFKTSVVYDSSSPSGNDFPLPGFLNDSGPNGSPEFRIKARGLRLGANFEWLDPVPKVTLTGRAEIDFEGDFPRANSRNIASIRSNQPNLRLVWMRADYLQNDKVSYHILFGQDWTPFASSTNPQTTEITGFHLAYGNIYQRLPQIRVGLNYRLSKNRNVRFQPEFAIALPLYGNLPGNVADQLGFGERQGVDSARPEIQGRFVLQFQLDKAAGVVPAQLIFSWMEGKRKAIVTRDGLVSAVNGNATLTAAQRAAIIGAFPGGTEVETERYGYTGEFQMPTRFFTVVCKYYNGVDLRGYFAGQLFSIYNDTFGFANTTNVPSIDASSQVVVGFVNGAPSVAPQRPIRGQGGFVNVGFPLSRIFGVDPKSRLAGFQAYLHYGYDEARPSDVRRLLGTTLNPIGGSVQSFGANRAKSDVGMGSIHYRVNSFVTFVFEQSYFRTRAANQSGLLPLFRGVPSRQTHNNRSEFATIFNF